MTTLTRRQKSLLKLLLDETNYITIGTLAGMLDVSERTVRHDLDYIADYLQGRRVLLNRKSGRGIRLESTVEERQLLKAEVEKLDNLVFDKQTRVEICYLYLFCNEKLTYSELAEVCQVSRQTIVNDFIEVEERLLGEDLSIVKTQGVGLKLAGEELNLRRVFEKRLRSYDDTEYFHLLGSECDITSFSSAAIELLERIQRHLAVRFVDKELVVILISFNLLRCANGHVIEAAFTASQSNRKMRQFDGICNILENIGIGINDGIYLCDLLLNCRIDFLADNEDVEESSLEYEMAGYLFGKLEEIYPLDKELREVLLQGMITHLRAAIYRSQNQISVKNVMLEQVKISIPLIYQFTKKELKFLEDVHQLSFDENEIAYIAMYIASAFENSYKLENVISVLLVCSFGVATSSILKTRIMQLTTNCEIIGPMTTEEASAYLQENPVDMVITTHDISYEKIPTVVVNPLLYGEDIEQLKEVIFQQTYSKMYNSFIKAYEKTAETNREVIELCNYVSKEDIQIVEYCQNWQEAIRLAAQPLVRKQQLEKRYVDKMIEAVDRFGTYMVLIKDTAFIHAGTEDGINVDCTAVLILHQPLLLGDKNPKSVSNFVVLGIKNKADYSLLNLVYVFEKEENLLKLRDGNLTVDDVYRLAC